MEHDDYLAILSIEAQIAQQSARVQRVLKELFCDDQKDLKKYEKINNWEESIGWIACYACQTYGEHLKSLDLTFSETFEIHKFLQNYRG